jgi:hypothetical protein
MAPNGTRTSRYTCTNTRPQIHYLKNDLKYKHSGATGKLVGVASIEDITVYYGSVAYSDYAGSSRGA